MIIYIKTMSQQQSYYSYASEIALISQAFMGAVQSVSFALGGFLGLEPGVCVRSPVS